jgi:hypothetical protein
MAKKIVLAGVVGGICFFVWQFIGHDVLPLGDTGIKGITNEETVIAGLQQNIPEPGFYFFPSGGMMAPGISSDQRKAAMSKMQQMYLMGPHGILIFDPHGTEPITPRQLLGQLGSDVVVMLVAAWLLAQVCGSKGYGGRVLFVTALGLIPTLTEGLSDWDWYGFPMSYTLAQLVIYLGGFGLAGLLMAKFVKPSTA